MGRPLRTSRPGFSRSFNGTCNFLNCGQKWSPNGLPSEVLAYVLGSFWEPLGRRLACNLYKQILLSAWIFE